jgi:hypothetical protein
LPHPRARKGAGEGGCAGCAAAIPAPPPPPLPGLPAPSPPPPSIQDNNLDLGQACPDRGRPSMRCQALHGSVLWASIARCVLTLDEKKKKKHAPTARRPSRPFPGGEDRGVGATPHIVMCDCLANSGRGGARPWFARPGRRAHARKHASPFPTHCPGPRPSDVADGLDPGPPPPPPNPTRPLPSLPPLPPPPRSWTTLMSRPCLERPRRRRPPI